MNQPLIIVRGGGDLATGTILRLWNAGFPVLILEAEYPSAIRRQVSLSEAVYEGTATVEGVTAVRISSYEESAIAFSLGKIPLLIDPKGSCIQHLSPFAVVDAILAKRNLGTSREMAPLTIALGPGFEAGKDTDFVIETKRGHNLGRIITSGFAFPDTGIPGTIGGFGAERVIHAHQCGLLYNRHSIGDFVSQGEIIAVIENETGLHPVYASISGIIRGLIRDRYPVTNGFKIADIDPRKEELCNCFTISDKARCIAGSVLELVCRYANTRGTTS